MKVKQLRDLLADLQDDDDICALLWDKPCFDDEEYPLTDAGWAKVCQEFDEWSEAGLSLSEWIADACIEYLSYSESKDEE